MKITYLDFKKHATTCWHSTHVPKNAIKNASEFLRHTPGESYHRWTISASDIIVQECGTQKGGSYCAIYRSISALFSFGAHQETKISLARRCHGGIKVWDIKRCLYQLKISAIIMIEVVNISTRGKISEIWWRKHAFRSN